MGSSENNSTYTVPRLGQEGGQQGRLCSIIVLVQLMCFHRKQPRGNVTAFTSHIVRMEKALLALWLDEKPALQPRYSNDPRAC
jgi:hypothetical protein